jgi:ABC-type multidrug transport system ATPase subunit
MEVDSGVIGILGPNGAGKSTLFRMLATVTTPSTGHFTWDGRAVSDQPDAFRRQLGYLPQDFGIYPNLTAEEFLRYLAAAKGIVGRPARERVWGLLALVNLSEARNRKLGAMSGGMKQRVGIAQALLNDPQLLIVDEPTAGLDPEERIRFRNLLGELAGDRVVLLSSHIVSDIEAVASAVAVVAGGRLLAYKTPPEMLALVDGQVWEAVVDRHSFERHKSEMIVSAMVPQGEKVKVRLIGDPVGPGEFRPVTPSLEDAYLFCLKQAGNGN